MTLDRPLVWLALDGVGHPADAPAGGPWARAHLPTLGPLLARGQALDAALGVPGLPQSATGQSCWLTGQNAVAVMGEHFGPQPGPTLRRLLAAASWPVRLQAAGRQVALLNPYPPPYFQQTRLRHGCFPYSILAAGLPLNPPGLPLVSPTLGLQYSAPWTVVQQAAHWRALGEQVGRLRGPDLLILDLWMSDVLGHQGRPHQSPAVQQAAQHWLEHLDALVTGLADVGAAVIITSDHGNFENLQVKTHTVSRVPFAALNVPLPQVADIVQGGQAIASLLGLEYQHDFMAGA
jgi:Metalloenzyme superfamily